MGVLDFDIMSYRLDEVHILTSSKYYFITTTVNITQLLINSSTNIISSSDKRLGQNGVVYVSRIGGT